MDNPFDDNTEFEIRSIQYEDDYDGDSGDTRIEFEYKNPAIAIDSAGRFKKHEIIGGKTVRQKTGEEPLEISISGVCKQDTAKKIDSLRDAKEGKLSSDRFYNSSIRVHFASGSTTPLEEGGAAELKSGEFLYTFSLNCVEVTE
jgi:hypothetical protein